VRRRRGLAEWSGRLCVTGCIAAMPKVCRAWGTGGGAAPRRLTHGQMTMLAAWVATGPDAAKDGVVRRRRRDLQARIAAEFGVTLHGRTVGKQLAVPGFRRLSLRPQHPGSDPEAQTAFKKTSPKR